MSEHAWVVDGLAQFIRSPMWTVPVNNFIDDKCIFFDSDTEMKLEYTPIHREFQEIVDGLLTTYISELGVSPEDTFEAVKQAATEENSRYTQLVEYITYLDDFQSFKVLMEKRNAELEYEAMKALGRQMNADGNVDEREALMRSKEQQEQSEMERAIEESRRYAEMVMKEAELEDLELQRALALSLAMENERLARLKEQEANKNNKEGGATGPSAAPAPAASANAPAPSVAPVSVPKAGTAPAAKPAESGSKVSAEAAVQEAGARIHELEEKTMEARRRNLEEANNKVAAAIKKVSPPPEGTKSSAPASAAPAPAPASTPATQPVPKKEAEPYDASKPAVVRLTAPTAPAASTGKLPALAPIGRHNIAPPVLPLPTLPHKSFKDLQKEQPAPFSNNNSSPLTEKQPSPEEFAARQAELKKQRDLLIAMKKKERETELAEASGGKVTSSPAQGTGSKADEENKEKHRQMTIEIARRFRSDIEGECRK